jgi:opacity protein-like surface antigen
MKLLIAAALVAAQLTPAAAGAAELPRDASVTAQQRGTFAGARLRVPFGGREAGRARAGIAFTSVDRSRLAGGGERLRFGEGVELGFRAGEPLKLRLGGASLSERLGAADGAGHKRDSTGKVILKGVAVVAIIGVAVLGGLFIFYTTVCDGNRCDD